MIKKLFFSFILGCAIGAGSSVYFKPDSKTQIVEKEVEKVKTIRVTTKPDGTVIKEKETKNIKIEKDIISTVSQKPNWHLQISKPLFPFQNQDILVSINRRVMGPVFIGVTTNTKLDNIGVSVGVEF